MKDNIRGKAYVVGDSIDTDQIIPARHLVFSMTVPEERIQYGRYALSAVPDEGQGLPDGGIPLTAEGQFKSEYTFIVAGTNFGCGSSREHAPFALQEAGIEAVISESYARIFYRNAVDGGFLIPFESRVRLIEKIRTGDELEIDSVRSTITNVTTGDEFLLNPLGDVAEILKAGNVFEYARQAGFMDSNKPAG
jgi:3-isopropylmalate/(R)-2-methylmalate dehydratase small subunit